MSENNKSPLLLEGRPVTTSIYNYIRAGVGELKQKGFEAGLALVIVGSFPASEQYFQTTANIARRLSIRDFLYRLPETASMNEVLFLINQLNRDERVNGILVFLPLPNHIDQRIVLNAVSPEKDVDGLGAISIGRLAAEESTGQLFKKNNADYEGGHASFLPCTPYGVIKLLDHYGIEMKGKDVVIIGKSLTVGKSLALMALAKQATVTVCHKETKALAEKTRTADILCVAAGRPGLIKADMVKEGVIAIDIGINNLPDGKFVGDVDFEETSKKASAITPVPGGVGPVTIAILLKNTVTSAKRMLKKL